MPPPWPSTIFSDCPHLSCWPSTGPPPCRGLICDDTPHCRQHGLVRGGAAPFGRLVALFAAAAVDALDPPTSPAFQPPKCRERQFQRFLQMWHCGRAFESTGRFDAAKALNSFRRSRHSPSCPSRRRQRALPAPSPPPWARACVAGTDTAGSAAPFGNARRHGCQLTSSPLRSCPKITL